MTKKQQIMLRNYNYANDTTIYEAYERPSYYKVRAEQRILDEMRNNNGYDYRICGHNSCTFSCAYQYRDDKQLLHLVYHTAYNRYDFVIEE